MDPEQVRTEGVGVDLRHFDHLHSISGGVAGRSTEELGVPNQQFLGDGELGGGLWIIFIDDDGELFGEVGDARQRSVLVNICQDVKLTYSGRKAILACESTVSWRVSTCVGGWMAVEGRWESGWKVRLWANALEVI